MKNWKRNLHEMLQGSLQIATLVLENSILIFEQLFVPTFHRFSYPQSPRESLVYQKDVKLPGTPSDQLVLSMWRIRVVGHRSVAVVSNVGRARRRRMQHSRETSSALMLNPRDALRAP